jgi:hypothetical protein
MHPSTHRGFSFRFFSNVSIGVNHYAFAHVNARLLTHGRHIPPIVGGQKYVQVGSAALPFASQLPVRLERQCDFVQRRINDIASSREHQTVVLSQ